MVLRLRTGQLKNHASIPGNDERFFSSPNCPDLFWGPDRLLFNGYLGFFTWDVKQPGCETDHSPPAYTFITSNMTTLLHFNNIRPCKTTLLQFTHKEDFQLMPIKLLFKSRKCKYECGANVYWTVHHCNS